MFKLTDDEIKRLEENSQVSEISNIPILRLHLPGTDYTWLISSISKYEPHFAYGVYSQNGQIEIGEIDLDELKHIVGINRRQVVQNTTCPDGKTKTPITVALDNTFTGEYPLHVYFEVAKELGFISTDISRNVDVWKKHSNSLNL